MKTLDYKPELNLQDFYSFAKGNQEQQVHELLTSGVHIETMFENDTRTLLFFLRGFFVELSISIESGKVIEVIPLKQGYKFEHYFKVKGQNDVHAYRAYK